MYSIKIESGHGEISGSAIKLRSKFVKKFPNLQIQENVIQTIENLNKTSILDVFQFLMKAAASKDYLAQETHLEWTELTEDQAKTIWNEIRSQVNSTFKVFPCGEVFENICNNFMEVWKTGSFDFAIDLFKSVVKYLDSHSQDAIDRALFLLGSDMPNYNFGGIQELGYTYDEAVRFSKFSYQAFCLMDGLHMNNCYIAAVPLLQYFGEADKPESVKVEDTISESDNTEASTFEGPKDESSEKSASLIQEKLRFSTNEIVDFIKNYELFKGFFVAVGGLKKIEIEPQVLLDHEEEFCELLDTIDLNFKKR